MHLSCNIMNILPINTNTIHFSNIFDRIDRICEKSLCISLKAVYSGSDLISGVGLSTGKPKLKHPQLGVSLKLQQRQATTTKPKSETGSRLIVYMKSSQGESVQQ